MNSYAILYSYGLGSSFCSGESTGKLHRTEIWKQDKVAVASGFITTWEGSLSDVIGVPDALPCSCLLCLDDVVAPEEEKKKKWV